MSSYLVGIDVGGTFTDFVAYDRDGGTISVWKNLTTPGDPTDGILEGLRRIDDRASISHVRLGTTVATNAILERKGANVAYLATRGFRDVPFIQRGNRKSHYDILWIKPAPLVKHRNCHELDERIDRDGVVLEALDEAGLRRIVRELKASGEIEAIAVCLMFSFIEPKHERRAAAIIAEEWPDVPVSISYDVLPRWKEYERASTTIADAYLKPTVGPVSRRPCSGGCATPASAAAPSSSSRMEARRNSRRPPVRRSTWRCRVLRAASSAPGTWRS